MEMSKKAFGLTSGILLAIAIFLLTNLLLIKGTEGTLIKGLKNICFGYSFSYLGSVIGLVWGFVYGFISGWLFAYLYNLFAKKS